MKGVQAVLDGKLWLSREMMTKCIFEDTNHNRSSKKICEELAERQIKILAMIAVGASNGEISDKLCISPHTVKTHLYKIFENQRSQSCPGSPLGSKKSIVSLPFS